MDSNSNIVNSYKVYNAIVDNVQDKIKRLDQQDRAIVLVALKNISNLGSLHSLSDVNESDVERVVDHLIHPADRKPDSLFQRFIKGVKNLFGRTSSASVAAAFNQVREKEVSNLEPQDRAPPKPSIDVLGVDAKIHKLAAKQGKPFSLFAAFGFGEKYVSIQREGEKAIYVKMTELAKVLGVAETSIEGKTSQEVAELIEKHNHIVNEVSILVKSFAKVHEDLENTTSSLVKFTIRQLRGRERGNEALMQLKALAEKVGNLWPLITAGSTGSFYVGKTSFAPSLLVSDEKIGSSEKSVLKSTS